MRQVLGILRPRVVIPHHWDDFWAPMDDGPGAPFSNPTLTAILDAAGVELVVPSSYYQRFGIGTTLAPTPRQRRQRSPGDP